MSVFYQPLTSEYGFKSPGFLVDQLGNFSVASLNATGSLKIDGQTVLTQTTLADSVVSSKLTSVGTLTGLVVNGNLPISLSTTGNITVAGNNASVSVTNLTVTTTGAVTIDSGTRGTIDNVEIGSQTPAPASFTTVNISEGLLVKNQNLEALAVAYSVALS